MVDKLDFDTAENGTFKVCQKLVPNHTNTGEKIRTQRTADQEEGEDQAEDEDQAKSAGTSEDFSPETPSPAFSRSNSGFSP